MKPTSAAGLLAVALVAAACGSSKSSTTTIEPLAAAQQQLATSQANLAKANDALTAANQQFCSDAKSYVTALDRYGKLFTDSKATVGDVKTGGADLAAPRTTVSASANAIATARDDLATAQKDVATAEVALANAQAVASSVPPTATAPPAPTTTTVVPPATINRVKQAETDFAKTSAGITDETPLTQATAAFNSAAFALQIAWLKLLVDAGCVTDEQVAQAEAKLVEYTAALQTDLQTAGYYKGPIDGVYGPQTVAAVQQLQTEYGLPTTGFVDQATALALEKKLAIVGQQAATQSLTQTAALQTVLKLAGYWPGAIDGVWTQELTDALKQFQTALGVEPTGVVDTATMAAFQEALANLKAAATTTTTESTTTTTTIPPTTTSTTEATTTSG
jgi:peptidoglycan hydrolase-like protein with peptidoglycan-binding domain